VVKLIFTTAENGMPATEVEREIEPGVPAAKLTGRLGKERVKPATTTCKLALKGGAVSIVPDILRGFPAK
jgi:hypothetical protein